MGKKRARRVNPPPRAQVKAHKLPWKDFGLLLVGTALGVIGTFATQAAWEYYRLPVITVSYTGYEISEQAFQRRDSSVFVAEYYDLVRRCRIETMEGSIPSIAGFFAPEQHSINFAVMAKNIGRATANHVRLVVVLDSVGPVSVSGTPTVEFVYHQNREVQGVMQHIIDIDHLPSGVTSVITLRSIVDSAGSEQLRKRGFHGQPPYAVSDETGKVAEAKQVDAFDVITAEQQIRGDGIFLRTNPYFTGRTAGRYQTVFRVTELQGREPLSRTGTCGYSGPARGTAGTAVFPTGTDSVFVLASGTGKGAEVDSLDASSAGPPAPTGGRPRR